MWRDAVASSLLFSLVGLVLLVSPAPLLLVIVASRGPSVRDSSTLVLRPRGALRETWPDDLVGQIVGRRRRIRSRRSSGACAWRSATPRIANVLLMPSTLDLPYWAKLQELRDAVLDFRKSGKKVVAFLEYGGDREYYLASAADRVFLLPTSPLDLTGVASYELFLRGFARQARRHAGLRGTSATTRRRRIS